MFSHDRVGRADCQPTQRSFISFEFTGHFFGREGMATDEELIVSSLFSFCSFVFFLPHLLAPCATEGESLRSPSRNYRPVTASSASAGEMSSNRSVKSSSPSDGANRSVVGGGGHRANGVATASDGVAGSGSIKGVRHDRDSKERDSNKEAVGRCRSPPVVTIAPTLSLAGLNYQDSRKVTSFH